MSDHVERSGDAGSQIAPFAPPKVPHALSSRCGPPYTYLLLMAKSAVPFPRCRVLSDSFRRSRRHVFDRFAGARGVRAKLGRRLSVPGRHAGHVRGALRRGPRPE